MSTNIFLFAIVTGRLTTSRNPGWLSICS